MVAFTRAEQSRAVYISAGRFYHALLSLVRNVDAIACPEIHPYKQAMKITKNVETLAYTLIAHPEMRQVCGVNLQL